MLVLRSAYDARDSTSICIICNFITDDVPQVWTQVLPNGLRAGRVCLSSDGQYPLCFGRGLFRSKLSVNGVLESGLSK